MSDAPLAPVRSPLDEPRARRLLRCAGFGAPPPLVRRAVEEGLEATLEALLGTDGAPDPVDELDALFERAAADDADALRGYVCARMLRARAQLREKTALFWHGHFATSIAKVRDPALMAGQWRTFLELGLGSFEQLLRAVLRDPAMLVWLDAVGSRRERPNENLARELFELFTLGVGHYDEHDVREAARALTGFVRVEGRFRFEPSAHDDGEKRILGRSGRFGPDELASLAARHPATARRLARRFVRFFVGEAPAELEAPAVAALAERFAHSDLDVADTLRALFSSRWFFETSARVRRVLSPVEYVIGTIRTLGLRADGVAAARHAARMGQTLLAPPTVEGWAGGAAWIHTPRFVEAVRFAHALARGPEGGLVKGRAPAAPESGGPAASALVAGRSLPARVRERLEELSARDPRLALALTVALPEVHLS